MFIKVEKIQNIIYLTAAPDLLGHFTFFQFKPMFMFIQTSLSLVKFLAKATETSPQHRKIEKNLGCLF